MKGPRQIRTYNILKIQFFYSIILKNDLWIVKIPANKNFN